MPGLVLQMLQKFEPALIHRNGPLSMRIDFGAMTSPGHRRNEKLFTKHFLFNE